MKLIQRSKYLRRPWKNGLGLTEQIDLAPDGDSWRLSAATVQQEPSTFSEFKGQQRLLSIWRGVGLWLNEFFLSPDQVHAFSGEEPILCRAESGPVIDLGLIYDPKRVKATMQFGKFQADFRLQLLPGVHFLFCASGSFKAASHFLNEGDTLKVTGGQTLDLQLQTPRLKLILIHIVDTTAQPI